jgi:hypothetical protein
MLSGHPHRPANFGGTCGLNALATALRTAIGRFGIWNILILVSLSSVLTLAQTQTEPLGIEGHPSRTIDCCGEIEDPESLT